MMYNICISTVFAFRNVKFVIYIKDHGPPHIHAISPEAEVKIDLISLECFFSRGDSQRDLRHLIEFVSSRKEKFMEVFNETNSVTLTSRKCGVPR